ncbi:MAG: DUF4294 domain-containing protein [Bacteroidales bacterium]|nr:DUF4294 domain-containing protein [Bacteroidales bacterium]
MHIKPVISAIFLLVFALAIPQDNLHAQQKRGYVIGYIIDNNGDTLYVDKIRAAYVYNRPESWKKSKSWRQYYRMVYNFKKTYPYALKAKVIIQDADSTLKYSNFNAREREKYLKAYEKRLFKEFEKPLSNMSINQGKMLIKLIDREVGLSGFYLIKNYRGGLTAGFWQGIAKLFGSDLKKQYDKFGEDKLLEELVQMYHAGTFDYLYYSMFIK